MDRKVVIRKDRREFRTEKDKIGYIISIFFYNIDSK